MPSKRQQQADLAKAALNSVFDGSHTEGRVPNILKNTPAAAPASPPKSEPPGERPPRVTGLQLALPRGGFTHPEQGGYFMMPKEFKAILALEKKSVSQVVYEVIEQTIGWEDPGGRGGRREWVRLSLRHSATSPDAPTVRVAATNTRLYGEILAIPRIDTLNQGTYSRLPHFGIPEGPDGYLRRSFHLWCSRCLFRYT